MDCVVTRIMAAPEIEGITISGGEPMLQAVTLAHLINCARKQRDLGVILLVPTDGVS